MNPDQTALAELSDHGSYCLPFKLLKKISK